MNVVNAGECWIVGRRVVRVAERQRVTVARGDSEGRCADHHFKYAA